MADVVYINEEEGAKRVLNNTKLFVKLLGKFMDDNSMQELDAALAENDLDKAKIVAHTVKGVAANLSLMELQKQSLELETLLKSGTADANLIAVFKDVYSKTKEEVKKVIEKNG